MADFLQDIRLVVFDVDGVLVRPFTDDLLPGVAEWFEEVGERPFTMALVSNQGGVGLFYERQRVGLLPGRYVGVAETEARLWRIGERLGIGREWVFMSFAYRFATWRWTNTPLWGVGDARWGRNWRMPNPGMVLAAMAVAQVRPMETLVVGGEVAKAAAGRCGAGFVGNGRLFVARQLSLV